MALVAICVFPGVHMYHHGLDEEHNVGTYFP